MTLVILALIWLLQVYFWILIARFLIDLVLTTNPVWRPKGLLLIPVELVMTVTDPPLKFVRRFIKPVRVGAIALDFGWTLTLLATTLLQSFLTRLL
jgi:YggT family protein